ncbi:MAG: biotin--[acetyl-CoA-carboxylase] ligase [Flavobacteriales bacterium AspAUS03]
MQKILFPIHLICLPEVDSTNDFLNKTQSSPKDWTVIWAMHQTHGRGTRENTWQSEKNKNLTFSIALNPRIKAQESFLLNISVCNAIHKSLYLYNKEIWIKWPNDIILKHKKICGILIENRIYQHEILMSIIGIGLNVNQMNFFELSKASSLKKLLGKTFNLQDILMTFINNIKIEYCLFKDHGKTFIQNYYLNHLYKKGQVSSFQIDDTIYNGIIRGLTEDSQLIVTLEDQSPHAFSHKEIDLLY